MRLTVLGASGAWPTDEAACSGYLIEHDGYRLLVDPGYATFPALVRYVAPTAVDAVWVSHGHPDHCADLNPLLRARVLAGSASPRLAVHAPPSALSAVLALDRPGMLEEGYTLHERLDGDDVKLGPFNASAVALPHHVTNLGLRLHAAGRILAYTGDTGPCARLAELASGAHVYLAEATHSRTVPADDAEFLSTAVQAGRDAAAGGAHRLILTHLWPGSDAHQAIRCAAAEFSGPVEVARPGMVTAV